jgi:hypothetical protein
MCIFKYLGNLFCWLDENDIHPEHLLPDSWVFKRGYFYHISGYLSDGTNIGHIIINNPVDETELWKVLREYDWETLKVYQGKSPRFPWVCPKKKLIINNYI